MIFSIFALRFGEADAEGDLFDYRKEHMDEYIDAYTDMIAMYTKMAQEAEKDGSLSQANNFRQQALEAKEALLELTDAVPPFQKVIKEQVIDNLSDAFQSMLWGEKTAKEALEDFRRELQDRYGPLPEPVENLLQWRRLTILTALAGYDSLTVAEGRVLLQNGRGIYRRNGLVPTIDPSNPPLLRLAILRDLLRRAREA